MARVECGKTKEGKKCIITIDGYLKKILDKAIVRVKKHNWDYVCVISGYSGAGKSTLARTIARYCDHEFNENKIAFTDTEFIEKTNTMPEFSAIVLDESFESLNTKVTNSRAFLRIINHLQIIRQKHLFIILCLPNFFDLSKGIAVFRTNHLFVVYADEGGIRGRFMAFGRNEKRKLYVRGAKYMDYHAQKSNFYARFYRNGIILDEEIYEDMKRKHLMAQGPKKQPHTKREIGLVKAMRKLKEMGLTSKQIASICNYSYSRVNEYLATKGV